MGFDLASIFGSGVKEAIGSIGGIVDNLSTTKAEKEELKLKIQESLQNASMKQAEAVQAELDSYLKDTQDARASNTKIQESDKASWLAKNFAYVLDGLFCLMFGAMLFMIFTKAVPIENKELFYTGFGLLGGIVGTIINFHRGSSKGI